MGAWPCSDMEPRGPVHLRTAVDGTLVFHRPSSPQDRTAAASRWEEEAGHPTGSKSTLFVFGSAETLAHCAPSIVVSRRRCSAEK